MKTPEIEIGMSYHNGKAGPRSYSERKVIELNVVTHWNGGGIKDGVRYEQVRGMYRGKTSILPLSSFAAWAKGKV